MQFATHNHRLRHRASNPVLLVVAGDTMTVNNKKGRAVHAVVSSWARAETGLVPHCE